MAYEKFLYERAKTSTLPDMFTHHNYSRKLSREKTFANWWKIRFSWKNFADYLMPLTKEHHAPKFQRKLL